VRQRVAARIRHRTQDVWPIFPGSERAPDGWKGWPEGRRFAVVLTHDVERQHGVDNCRRLMQLEKATGFKSTFNFVPQGSYQTPNQLRQELIDNGFEVGVHDLEHDGRLFHSHKTFIKKAARINNYLKDWNASGFRSGFMLHNLSWLHELNISYDMSTFDTDPFEPQPEGYHTIFPFWVDREASLNGSTFGHNGARQGYVELPYTLAQDSTLFLLLGEQTPQIWLRKVDWIARHGGMVLVNIHPDYIDFDETDRKGRSYPAALVREFLRYLSERYCGEYWNPSAAELAAWYKEWYNSEQAKVAPEQSTAFDRHRLQGKRAAVVLFSHYPADPRPRRAAEALAAEGVTSDLVCLQANSSEPRREIVNGVNVTRVPLKRRRSGKFLYAWQYFAFTAISFGYLTLQSLRKRYDFVHVHNMPDVLVFSAIVPKLLGAKIVLDLHDPMPELMQTIFELPGDSAAVRGLKAMEKSSTRFADVVLTVNKACKRIYSSRSCPAEKITIVINSPDDAVFKLEQPSVSSKKRDAQREFVIMYHGSLVHRNGFDLAVDALEALHATIPQAVLVVCGARTAFFDSVMESVRQRGLQEKVRYLGPQDTYGIVREIKNCDLGVVPNHRNLFTEINTPTRIFEYLALGKPVIAPRAGGILDYFGEKDLIYFNLGDARDLARQIESVYSNPEQIDEAVRRGQEVYRHHTWTLEKTGLVKTVAGLFANSSN
jgi:glycosyltransferase involved in cell wall biosynthesis/peptidoglycan/xylan/chitin deacetylase (PgdA/CDA1 family)